MRMSLSMVHDIHYVPQILRILTYVEGYLPLQLVMSIGFLGKVEPDVKEIDWLIQVVVFLGEN